MELVPGFMLLVQGLSSTMTAPTFDSLTTVLAGWIFAGRRTVTRMILAAGPLANKHYSSYHRLFSAARWSLDSVGLALFELVEPLLDEVVMLGLDNTLARKRGLKMFGTAMHHDPILSSRKRAIMNWGHSWVVLGVITELPFRKGHYFFLPILFRLYLTEAKAARYRRAHRLPTPEAMLAGRCRRITLNIYGRNEWARVADACARVYAAPECPLRVVAVEALSGGRGQQVFYSTCHDASAEQVITWYAMRWSVEVTFHDSKQHLGFEEPQGWSRPAAERTAPMAMLLYSLVVLWFTREGQPTWEFI